MRRPFPYGPRMRTIPAADLGYGSRLLCVDDVIRSVTRVIHVDRIACVATTAGKTFQFGLTDPVRVVADTGGVTRGD